jgi:protoheme IX farnesyltransferase
MGLHTSVDVSILTATLLGTALTSGSATALNQYLEVPFDSQMKRTQNRPLVVGHITPLHAIGFATVSGITGLTLLSCVNSLTAILGASNLLLYAFIYTPMKRAHVANTWVGAIVGAIPPVMGFTAANNFIGIYLFRVFAINNSNQTFIAIKIKILFLMLRIDCFTDMSAILMGLILYSWQFPHFNALSWNMRHDYARAGFRMMSVTEPKLCLDTALRHSCFILIYSTLMCTCLTTWTFGVDSLPLNVYLIYLSWKFRSDPNSKTSRKLFFYSLIHLPAIIMLMLISKRRITDKTKVSNDSNNKINHIKDKI